jgi:hypothetical protein
MGQTRTVHIWAPLIEQSVDNEHQRIHTTKMEMVNKFARSITRTQYRHFDDVSSRTTNVVENHKYPLRFHSKDI